MRYDAIAVGENEWRRTPEILGWMPQPAAPLLSVVPPPLLPENATLAPYRIFDAGARRLAVVGTSVPDGIPAVLPLADIGKVLGDLGGRADALVVVGSFPPWEAFKLAKAYPTVDLILGASPGAETKDKPITMGSTLVAYPTEKGKQILEIHLRLSKGSRPVIREFKPVTLGKGTPEDPVYLKRVEETFARLREKAVAGARASGAVRAHSTRFAGAEACLSCHESAGKVWKTSAHAAAFSVLVPQGFDFDPECVRCHVTGMNEAEGFIDAIRTPDLENVQCEACHGAGAVHAADPRPGFGAIQEAPALCLRCHVPERSENFDFSIYWKRIAH